EKMADIYPIVGGQVLSVDAELGDHVTKGQTLAVIRSSEVADMTHQLSDAQSDVTVAQKNLNVQQDLFNSKLISERDLVSAQQDADKAAAQLKRMQESFSIYHFQNGSEYDVKAPTSGYIIAKDIAPDVMLPADQNTKIFTVAELDEVWVLADVYESDISRVKEGMPADITTLSYPGKVYHGKVDKIYNLLDPETRTERIRIRLPNPDISLKPEMIANVKLRFQEDHSLPSISSAAIIEDDGHQYVMVFKDRFNLKTREITTDHSNGGTTWVSAGLKPGETVVSKQQLFLYDALNDR
ncbi:MAG: efflux RND transporter periplasmic adaptor subunit, partial [Flavobacteriales bacterium]